jgi:hypothetical protein
VDPLAREYLRGAAAARKTVETDWIQQPIGDQQARPSKPPSFVEIGGEELVQSTISLADLPYLPLLSCAGWLVQGWSHIVAGYPRVGKTDLMMAIVREWLDTGHRILYITEEPQSIWGPRMQGRPGEWSGLRVVFGLGCPPDQLRQRARDGAEDVVIVDAIRNLLQLKDEKDNSEIAQATNRWVADARNASKVQFQPLDTSVGTPELPTPKTLVMVHHSRKGGGEHGEGIAGGHALLGGFDIAIEVLRDPNQSRERRLIRSYARLIESREAVYERCADNATFRLLGDPSALRLEDVSSRLLAALDGSFRSTHDLHASLGDPRPSEEQVRRALTSLAEKGTVLRDPAIALGQQRGKAHRWATSKASDSLAEVASSNGSTYRLELNSEAPDIASAVLSTFPGSVLS